MTKLQIFRGEALLDERDLTEQTVRIGRSPQNDIVLEDPGKGVSRNHAEIRFEHGRYTLFDHESQNGIWVSGTRVPSVVLDPGVVATVGPFRLTVKAPPTVAPAVPVDTATELTQLSERSAAPLVLESLGPLPDEPAPPPAAPKPLPAPKPPAAAKLPPPQKHTRVWAAAGMAVLLIAVAAVVAYMLMQKPDRPVWDPPFAETLVANGRCQEALETQINPALRANPNDQQALALRDKCNAPPPPPPPTTTSVPPAPTVAERLDEAESLTAAKDCVKALEMISAVLAEEPANERAKGLFAKATACGKPPVAPPPTDRPAVKVAPAEGGLEPNPNESDKAYKSRIAAMRKKYDEAVALLETRRSQQAARLFDEIASVVPPGYLDLAERRDEARTALRAEAKKIVEAAQAAENRRDFDAAIEAYRHARELDPSLQVEGPIKRVTDQKITFGRERCKFGRTEYAFGNNAGAIPALQDAVRMLPASDECHVAARQILQKLGK